jgi:hypothetical protein
LNWEGFGRKKSGFILRHYYYSICMEGIKHTIKTLDQDFWSPGRGSNSDPLKNKALSTLVFA